VGDVILCVWWLCVAEGISEALAAPLAGAATDLDDEELMAELNGLEQESVPPQDLSIPQSLPPSLPPLSLSSPSPHCQHPLCHAHRHRAPSPGPRSPSAPRRRDGAREARRRSLFL
jgi:hypothetical protein